MSNLTSIKKFTIYKSSVLKTKTKKSELISFTDPTGIISAFDFLSAYVKTDAITKGLTIYATEFGYNLLDADQKIKFEFTIEEIS